MLYIISLMTEWKGSLLVGKPIFYFTMIENEKEAGYGPFLEKNQSILRRENAQCDVECKRFFSEISLNKF